MKRFKLKTLLLAVLYTLGISQTWAISGTGRINDPYLIYNATDLNAFATNVGNSTSPGGTHYRTVYGKLMADMTASSNTLALTRACVLDFGGHTLTIGDAIYTQNKTDAIVLMNGTLKGGMDGNGGYVDAYPYGTVALYNMTVTNNIWTDGHHYYILGSTTGEVKNVSSTDGQGGTSYTGTVYTNSDISSTSYNINSLEDFKAFAFRVDGSSTELTGKLTANVTIPGYGTGTGGDGSSLYLRKPCTLDLNGKTITNTLYVSNESGTTYVKNGTVGNIDGEGGSSDIFPNSMLDLTNMTVTDYVFADGRKVVINSGYYGNIANEANTDRGSSTTYTGTVTLKGGYYKYNPNYNQRTKAKQTGVAAATGYTLYSTGSTVANYPYYVTPNTYTVTYNTCGGTCSSSTKQVTYDSTYGTLATPTREGYTFAGWFTAASGGSEVTSSTKFATANNNTVIYAHWTPNATIGGQEIKPNEALTLEDDKDLVITGNDVTVSSISYSRNLTYDWGTVCLPFAVTSDANVQYYTLSSVDATAEKMYFEPATTIEANTPAVFKSLNSGNYSASSAGSVTLSATLTPRTTGDWKLVGTFAETTLDKTNNANDYYIAQNQFWQVSQSQSGVTIPAYRAYFTTTASGAKASSLSISIWDGNEATAIGTINANGDVNVNTRGKYIENGRIVIIQNDKKYNTAGQQVK